MRVALVTTLERGGPLEHSVVLARALVERGVDVRAVCATEAIAEGFAAAGAEPVVAPVAHGVDTRGGRELQRALSGVDVVHAQDRRAALWTRLLRRPRGAALVQTVHGLPDEFLPPPVGAARPGVRATAAYRWFDAGLARRADAVITPSRAVADALRTRLGYPAGRIRVIPNGVVLPSPLDALGDEVGSVSVLEPVKALDVLIAAAARLPDVRFTVFGTGSAETALRAQAARLGAPVEFAGHVPAAEAFARLRVFVLPSYYENSPMALLEAMALGVPAVATRAGGIPEIAVAGTAALVPPGDPAALAGAIAGLLDDPAAARAQAAAARVHVERAHSAALMAERTVAVYERARGDGPLRILSVSAALDAGGAERMAIDLANALTASGHHVAVAAPPGTLDGDLSADVGRMRFPALGRSPLRAAITGVRLARFVREWEPDVIHSHNVKATAIAAAAGRLGGCARVVATFHGVVSDEDFASARILRAASVVVCVSDDLRGRLAAAGVAEDRLRTIPNAVPAAQPLAAARRAAIDAELGLDDAPVVAFVGRLAPVKAPERFLDAAAIIATTGADARFLVVGDGELRAELERRARSVGLDGRVTFTGLRADARDLIARADVVAVTSDSEGMSVVTLEALAAGVPVVTTAVPGMRELLGSGAGLVAATFTPEAVAAAITDLLGDPERRAAMAAVGPPLVARQYGLDAMIERYSALFAEVSAPAR